MADIGNLLETGATGWALGTNDRIQLSIAISLKRIANQLCGAPEDPDAPRIDLVDCLTDLAEAIDRADR